MRGPLRGPLQGLMMDFPLTLAPLLERAGKLFGKVEIVSRRPDRTLVRSTYVDFSRRARKLARALTDAGLGRGRFGGRERGVAHRVRCSVKRSSSHPPAGT